MAKKPPAKSVAVVDTYFRAKQSRLFRPGAEFILADAAGKAPQKFVREDKNRRGRKR